MTSAPSGTATRTPSGRPRPLRRAMSWLTPLRIARTSSCSSRQTSWEPPRDMRVVLRGSFDNGPRRRFQREGPSARAPTPSPGGSNARFPVKVRGGSASSQDVQVGRVRQAGGRWGRQQQQHRELEGLAAGNHSRLPPGRRRRLLNLWLLLGRHQTASWATNTGLGSDLLQQTLALGLRPRLYVVRDSEREGGFLKPDWLLPCI